MTDQKGGELVSLASQSQDGKDIVGSTEARFFINLDIIQERLGLGDANVTNPNLRTQPSLFQAARGRSGNQNKKG